MRKAPISRWLPGVSRGTMAALLLAVPVAAGAAGFAGTGVVMPGSSASITAAGSVQTVNIPTSSPVTTINWKPTDTATGGGAIDFLPAGQTVSYVGATGASVPYTVLNRIIPTDQTRTVAFNGTVTSSANTRVWFYSPGGLLIGATGVFNVGGLVLTTADPVRDSNNNFITTTAGTDSFSFASTAGSTSAITINPGAKISALTSSQSNYIVAIAPQINQGGAISVAGSVALVAAESASFAVDPTGLFNITVDAGTTVTDNTFVHTGSTGGPGTPFQGGFQRVYMVAVPKNNAISMAIASSGSIGFAVADAANLDGEEIVLSAGGNIADITAQGAGNPVVGGRAGSGAASLTVGAGSYTSNTYAVSTDAATITDPAGNVGFASGLTVIAPSATVNAAFGTITVGGDLVVNADKSSVGAAGSALIEAGPGASLAIGSNAAALSFAGSLTETADDRLTGVGGSAMVQATQGSITVNGNALITANGQWDTANQNSGSTPTQGGTAQVAANGGTLTVGGRIDVIAAADATGAQAALIGTPFDQAIVATGGTAAITATGAAARISAANGLSAGASATSGIDAGGDGGSATAGSALIEAAGGGAIGVGVNGAILAYANASPAFLSPFVNVTATSGVGAVAVGGTAQVIADAGKITVAGLGGISVIANAAGGSPPAFSGNGGNATGGLALVETRGTNASIVTNTSALAGSTEDSTLIEADATGGGANGSDASSGRMGGNAVGGTARLAVTGANQTIAIDGGNPVSMSAIATGGFGVGGMGGSATGGSVQILATGGALAITNAEHLTMTASATGGEEDFTKGGAATGGTVQLAASDGGTAKLDVASTFSAKAVGGFSYSGNGGDALGGNVLIDLGNNAVSFAGTAVAAQLDASFVGGSTGQGQTGSPGSASSAGGVRLTDLGAVSLGAAITLTGNTPFYVQADGSIAVPGSITGSGAGAYLHLWADDLGTGSGTVTLADGALNLPGNLIDIYYNPTSLGTPTDFSAGIAAGTGTAYQLVDNIDQLQRVGGYLSQNFALSRNVDASATAGWNGGAGFVPIGTFTGNFDGLGHTITNLYEATQSNAGLFDFVGAGTSANIVIRNVGIVDPNLSGDVVGGLVADVGRQQGPDNVTISNSYVTGGSVTGKYIVGGLAGYLYGAGVTLTNAHSDTAVTGTSVVVGGLVGTTYLATITDAYATGSVTANSAGATQVGGLVGLLSGGSLTNAYSTGPVSAGSGSSKVGGLVGWNFGTINNAYSTGSVTVGAGSDPVGGLAGLNNAAVNGAWASGAVSAVNSTKVAGFVGQNSGTITNSYWDTYSTGQAMGVGTDSGTTTNLNPVTSDPAQQYSGNNNYAFGASAYANLPNADWTYDNDLSRPVGAWETPVAQFGVATIESAHQVQLIDFNLAGSYTITQNIDMRGTGGTSDIWGPQGFMPLGGREIDPPLTGTLEGAGHVLSNLTIAPNGGFYNAALIQENYGTISDLGLANVNISAANSYSVGAIAGYNAGQIIDSFATGTITLTGSAATSGVAGGLVGQNYDGARDQGYFYGNRGTITQSYASVAVSGGAAVGGLVGDNEGGIDGSYANGAVSGTLTGGLVGQSTDLSGPTVSNSYWDAQLSGQSEGCGSAGYAGACSGVTALTTAQTLQSASFNGFSIDTSGGQGLRWRQYEGLTTPLLEAFLTPITVKVDSVTTQYNAQVPDVGVTTYGAQPSLTFGTAQVNGLIKNAGVSYLTYAGGLYSNQLGYDFIPATNPGTLVITQAPLTLSATSDTKGYDATTNSSGEVQVSGLFGQDSVTNLSQSFSSANVLGTNGSTLVVNGEYSVNDGTGGNNYSVTLQSAQGTINPAALTLAAMSDSKVYDATTDSAGAVQVSGLFGQDDVTSLTQSFTSPNAMGPNGSTLVVNPGYMINDGNGGANYTVSLQSAQGTITPAELTLMLTLAAVSDTKVYDGTTNSSGIPQTIGLMGSDNVTNLTQSFTSPNVMGINGSTLVVDPGYVVNDGNGGNNYNVTLQSAQGTITPAELTLTAARDSKVYDATTGSGGVVRVSGLFGQDNVASLTQSFASANVMGANGSTLVVDPGYVVNDGNGGANYTVALQNARGTITPAALAITYTANRATITYGTTPSALSGTVSQQGLQGSDTLASVTSGTASFTTTATAQSNAGRYAITGSGLAGNSGNYTFAFGQAEGNATALTIGAASLTVDVLADAQSRSYGSANPALTYSETGLVNGDMLTGSLATTATINSNVGVYAITQGTLSAGSNYSLNYTGANLTVNPAALTVTYTANTANSVYGTVPGGLSGSVGAAGLVLGQTLGSVTSGAAVFATTAGATSNVGTYAITGSGLTANSGNYRFSFVQAPGNATALTIDPASLSVIADPQSRTYGAANPALTFSETGLVNGDVLSGGLATGATTASNVGNYAITQGTLAASSNYRLSYTDANLTIDPASLTVTYTANPLSSIYGTVPGGLSGSVGAAGLVLGQTLGSVTSGAAVFTTAAGATSNVGTYAITGSGLTANSGNYSFNFIQASGNATALTIDPASLSVIADPQSRTYGASNPTLTYSETGLVNDDVLSGGLATGATTSSNVGNYAITQGSLTAGSNYTLNYTGANLTINPAALTVTYTANPQASIYGTVPSGLSGSVGAAGLVLGQTLGSVTGGAAVFSTTAGATSNVGAYAITGSGLSANSNNYNFNFVQAADNATALTILQRALTLTANPLSRIYGGANPTTDNATAAATTGTTGLVNGDSVSGEAVTSPATSGSNVGSYALNGSAAQFASGAASNYVITYATNPAGLAITPANATITYTANPLSSIYGNAPTGLTGTESASGLVNGDTLSSLTSGLASFATTATGRSNVGSYAVTGSGLADNSGNYSFSFVQAASNATALTIVQRALTLTANPLSRTYGGANPTSDTVTATGAVNAAGIIVAGLVNGDSVSSETVTTPATSGSGVGSYALNGSVAQFGSGLASNYAITYAANPTGLSITPAAATITYLANSLSSIYGNVPGGLTGTERASGLVNGDTLGSVTGGAAVFTTTAGATSNVGSYAITGAGLTAASNNYRFSFVQAPGNATALTIDPASLSVIANAQSRTYGAANPALTYTETGLVNGDVLSGGLATGATTSSNVGNYAITQGSLSAGRNYTLSYTGANLTINPASLTVTYTANPLGAIYGNAPTGLSGTESAAGLVNDDTLGSVTSGTAGYATSASGTSNVGSYAITGSGLSAASKNYSFSFVQAAGNSAALTIAARALTLTADPLARVYGGVNPTSDTATAAAATATTGLVNGDRVASETVTSPASSGSGVGRYALDGSNAQFGAGLGSNYAITYAGNATGLAITPAALTLTYTATPGSSTYGQAPVGLTGSIALTGLVNDDSAASVTRGSAAWASPATATSNVGSYAINGSGVALASANYALTSVQAPGNATALTVNPAALAIVYVANPASQVYGAANPALSGTEQATGLVNDDTLGSVTSGSAAYTTTATATSDVGSYAITGAGLAGSSKNYTYRFSQADGNASALTITPAFATITYIANPLGSIYGNAPSGLSGSESVSGLVNDDTLASVTSGTVSFATSATGASNVGSYAITGTGLSAENGNYRFNFVQAEGNANALTITPRPITATADPQQRAAGAANPVFSYVVTSSTEGVTQGLVNGDTLTGQLTSQADVTSPAGTYDILQGTLAASANYRLNYVGNILTLVFAVGPIAEVTNLIEANLPDQTGTGSGTGTGIGTDTPEQRRKREEAGLAALYSGLGVHPLQITQSMINDRAVTTPPPVNEPVTSNGNSSLWSRGAP